MKKVKFLGLDLDEYFKSFPSIYVGGKRKYPYAGIIAGSIGMSIISLPILFINIMAFLTVPISYFVIVGIFYFWRWVYK